MKLLEPNKIFNLELQNRIVRSATAERASNSNGVISEDYMNIYKNLAISNVGLIITGHTYINNNGKNGPLMAGIDNDNKISKYRELTDWIHENSESKIIMQISSCGRQTNYTTDEKPPIAPSVVPAPKSMVPREATIEEIEELINNFANAALRAKIAGFDGIQLHGAHGYLISQFVSQYTNKRNDKYGGTFEKRFRFLKEIIIAVQNKVGLDFPLLIKWNSEDFVEGGLGCSESIKMVFEMEKLGISAIEISGGIFESATKICKRRIKTVEEEGYFASFAKKLKDQGLAIPILLVGGFKSASKANEILEKNIADLISFSRPLIHNSNMVSSMQKDSNFRSKCRSCNLCLLKNSETTKCHI